MESCATFEASAPSVHCCIVSEVMSICRKRLLVLTSPEGCPGSCRHEAGQALRRLRRQTVPLARSRRRRHPSIPSGCCATYGQPDWYASSIHGSDRGFGRWANRVARSYTPAMLPSPSKSLSTFSKNLLTLFQVTTGGNL